MGIRRASRSARAAHRGTRSDSHLRRDRRRAPRSRRSRRQNRRQRPARGRLSRLGPGRPGREHDRLGGAHPSPADRTRRQPAGPAIADSEPRQGDGGAPRPPARPQDRPAAGGAGTDAQDAGRHRRPLRQDSDVQLSPEPGHRSSHRLYIAQSAGDSRRRSRGIDRGVADGRSRRATRRRGRMSARHEGAPVPMPAESTVGALVGELAMILSAAGLDNPGRGATDIITALREVPRFWTSVNAHVVVTAAERESARAAARRLAAGATFAYAVGTAAFRKLTLAVDERVLIPRPETELIVDIVLELTKGLQGGTAIDVGTGSGAIALSLAAEGSFDRVLGGDLSS